jgi:hypothetical protein
MLYGIAIDYNLQLVQVCLQNVEKPTAQTVWISILFDSHN